MRTAPDSQAAVLYLNPPYDNDPVAGRSEERFLRHFTPWLAPGAGWLLSLVPHYALEALANTLAGRYHDLRCWRLPPEDYAAFRQVLVLGRNVVMKALTSLTLVLALPSLVASFYGMNVTLPFQQHPWAFGGTLLVSLGLGIAVAWLFRRRRWL